MFDEMQSEIQDNLERKTDHFNGTVTTTPIELSTSTNKVIQLASIYVPSRGPNANTSAVVLLVSWDGINYVSYPRGSSEMWPGKGYGTNNEKIKIKADSGSVKYEIKLLS